MGKSKKNKTKSTNEPNVRMKLHVNSLEGKFLFVESKETADINTSEIEMFDPLKLDIEVIKEVLFLKKHVPGLENTVLRKKHTTKQIFIVLTEEEIKKGRPKTKIEINFVDPFKNFEEVERLSKLEGMQNVLKEFGNTIINLTSSFEDKNSKPVEHEVNISEKQYDEVASEDEDRESENDKAFELIKEVLESIEKSETLSKLMKLFTNILTIDQKTDFLIGLTDEIINKEESVSNRLIELIKHILPKLTLRQQNSVCSYVGSLLNSSLLYQSNVMPTAKELTLNDLKTCPKSEFYSQCDGRLIAYLDSITKKTGKTRQTSSATKEEKDTIVNFKSNAYENILKARNLKCVTIPGIIEHLVVYLSSGKSRHTTQVVSKSGAKGTRPVIEQILNNSLVECKFVEPKNKSLFFSFDNIQKLLKSYRIGGKNQEKALAVVVTSVLAILPDGKTESDIQYIAENSPEFWFHDIEIDKKNQVIFEKLNSTALKSTIKNVKEESSVLSDIFRDSLKEALKYVDNDMDSNSSDSITQEIRNNIQKTSKNMFGRPYKYKCHFQL